jgi:hypothetical protein
MQHVVTPVALGVRKGDVGGTHRKDRLARVGSAIGSSARVVFRVEVARMPSCYPHTAGRRRIVDPRDVRPSVRSALTDRPTRPTRRPERR